MTPTKDMTDESLRIELASLLGWKIARGADHGLMSRYLVTNPEGQEVRADALNFIPSWPGDLNAVHEAEKALGFHRPASDPEHPNWGLSYAYWRLLKNVEPDRLYATARQRTEALVETLRKRGAE